MSSTYQVSSCPVRNGFHLLSSRASSATLFLAQLPHNHIDGAADPDDMIIAQGLLQRDSPRIPQRRSSFSHSTDAQLRPLLDGNDASSVMGENRRDRRSRHDATSITWTSSSGDGSEDDGNDDRTLFVQEYNRLAKKYGVQVIVPDEFVTVHVDKVTLSAKQGSWLMRKILRRTSSSVQTVRHKTEKYVRHKRSVSDLSLRMKARKDTLKDKELPELIRLCGASTLYLPADYAAGTLTVPTCFRATAQYLIQHAATSRGIFRIPGSHSTINALYDHYASEADYGELISGTVRCPTLPEHIKYSVHDVASAFKKFLAGLPGGILGKAWLFDAFDSIHSQLDPAVEWTRTKQSRVRARLIALAVASVNPRYQRELICAVLGLLSMIGRTAETAIREDERGRPLPTSDLMGYRALGVVFGPLLIGELLDSHNICSAGPLVVTQSSSPKSLREKHKKSKSAGDTMSLKQGTDKIRIVNSITEMLITHWRDVVRHMKSLGALRSTREHHDLTRASTRPLLRPSASDSFAVRRPPEWAPEEAFIRQVDRSRSPTPSSRNAQLSPFLGWKGQSNMQHGDTLLVRKRRSRPKPMSSHMLSGAKSMSILAPTAEENPTEDRHDRLRPEVENEVGQQDLHSRLRIGVKLSQGTQTLHMAYLKPHEKSDKKEIPILIRQAWSHLSERGTAHRESKVESAIKHSKQTSEQNRTQSQVLQQTPQETEKAAAEKEKAIRRPVAMGERKYGSPAPRDRQKHLTELPIQPRAVSSLRQSLDSVQPKSKVSGEIPQGIVSSRLRGIAASDPGSEPPSALYVLSKMADIRSFQQNRKPNLNRDSSHVLGSFAKDPLARISQEEDMASLASLAKVIQSQSDILDNDSSAKSRLVKRPDTSFVNSESRTSRRESNSITSGLSNSGPSSNLKVENNLESQPEITRITTPAIANKAPVTPRRSATDSKMVGRGGGGTVKALASRFNSADVKMRRSPSPIHTPEPLHMNGSLLGPAVISPYTTNSSRVQKLQKWNRSDRSLQVIRNPLLANRYSHPSPTKPKDTATPLWPKPLFTSESRRNDSGRFVEQSLQLDSDSPQKTRVSAMPFLVSSNLHKIGDGNVSFTISRKSSRSTILAGPNEPPVAEHMNYARPSTPQPDYPSSPSYFSATSPAKGCSGFHEIPVAGETPQNRGASMLYSRKQLLRNQLKAKTDEAEQLRRPLMTKGSLNDLGTLSEQLRQTKRELEVWRSRAEIAEKRLEMFLSSSPKQKVEENAKDQSSDTDDSGNACAMVSEDDGITLNQIRRALHGLGGAEIEQELLESEGTVRRLSPKQHFMTEDGSDNFDEAKENRPASCTSRLPNGLQELE